jgi:hypothetical protein
MSISRSNQNTAARLPAALLSLALPSLPAVAWAFDETGGDFSNDPNLPTPLAFLVGKNVVRGSVVTPGDTRDVVRFTIPANGKLTALRLGSYSPINTGFHGRDVVTQQRVTAKSSDEVRSGACRQCA